MPNEQDNIKIFIAYSRKDEEFLSELRVFLHPLEQNKGVDIWYDGEIVPGETWEDTIRKAIHEADIILLLASPNSLASEYFYDNEVKHALERHRTQTCTVIPVILRPCGWEDTELAALQVLPKDGVPVSVWSNRDQAYKSVFDGIKAAIARIQEQRNPVAKPVPVPPKTSPQHEVAPPPLTPKVAKTPPKTASQPRKPVLQPQDAPPNSTGDTPNSSGKWLYGSLMIGLGVLVFFWGVKRFVNREKRDTPDPQQPTPGVVISSSKPKITNAEPIVAGKGFGDVEIGKTSVADLKKYFGEPKEVKQYQPISAALHYPDRGLIFYIDYKEYNAVKPDNAKMLKTIYFEPSFKGHTGKGITMGQSTLRDVANTYGEGNWETTRDDDYWYLTYTKLGIRFGAVVDKSLPKFPLQKATYLDKTVERIQVYK